MKITFSEFEKLPKKEINKKFDLIPGKKYYIQRSRGLDKFKEVFIGVYKHKSNGMNMFEGAKYLISPYGSNVAPSGYDAKSGFKFFEVISGIPSNSVSSRSRSRSSSSSRSSSKKGGRKHKKRTTLKRHKK